MQHATLYNVNFDFTNFNGLAFQLFTPCSKFEEIKSNLGPFKKIKNPDAETYLDVKLSH
jgi:hypothetical protein